MKILVMEVTFSENLKTISKESIVSVSDLTVNMTLRAIYFTYYKLYLNTQVHLIVNNYSVFSTQYQSTRHSRKYESH